MARFEAIKVGDHAESSYRITEEDVKKFSQLTGDHNKLHLDKEFAAGTQFKKPVVHGMYGASFIASVIGTKLPGDGALWYSQNLEFLRPIRVGDVLHVYVEVTKKIKHSQTLLLKTVVKNQNKQEIILGSVKTKIVSEEKKTKSHLKSDTGDVVLVIGATGGIGTAVCKILAREKYRLAIHYHCNRKKAEQILDESTTVGSDAILVTADICDIEDTHIMVNDVIRKFGNIDALVNCSTIAVNDVPFHSLSWKDFECQMNMNIKGFYNLIVPVLPIMEAKLFGNIIGITTQYIDDVPPKSLSPYVTAKSALKGFLKALAVEVAPKGIRVNMVAPGMTETNLIADIPEKQRLITAAKTPLQRLASPDDVAGVIAFLLSGKACFMTGETIRVNGGQVML